MSKQTPTVIRTFTDADALRYGLREAIALQTLRQWIAFNRSNGANNINGRTWAYNTLESWRNLMPFFTALDVREAFASLREQGVLVVGHHSASKFDRTMWYAFDDEAGQIGEHFSDPEGKTDSDFRQLNLSDGTETRESGNPDESGMLLEEGSIVATEKKAKIELSDAEWIANLEQSPAYKHIIVLDEHARMVSWCSVNNKRPTRKRFINWLNRIEKPMGSRPARIAF